jgi:hypothetical protein
MPEPAADPIVRPGVDPLELDAVDAADGFAVSEPQAVDKVEPPPSNAEFEVVFGHGMTSGLIPGWLSSVAPSGMPLELEGAVPSGEVAPMPGAGTPCAHAAATPINHIIAAKVHARRIGSLASKPTAVPFPPPIGGRVCTAVPKETPVC